MGRTTTETGSTHEYACTAFEVLLLAACALLAVRGCWGHAVGSGGDLYGTLWYQEWIDHCVSARADPGFTPWLFHPDGMDLFAHMGNNYLDMLVGLPFYWLLGSPGHMAPLTALILFGNALAMRVLLRSLVRSRLAIVAGCLLFELHPFVINELNGGRPTQALLWFWPLALHQLLAMGENRRWWRPVLAGVFVALQAITYWFTGHMFLLVFGPLLLIFGLRQDKGWWLRLALAAGVAIVLVMPFVLPMGAHVAAEQLPGAGDAPSTYSRGAVHLQRLAFTTNLTVTPWRGLVLLACSLVACRRRSLWIPASALCMLAFVGPSFHLAGHGWSNPFWTISDTILLGFDRFFYPDRFWAPLMVVTAAALAEALDARFQRPRFRALALAAAVLLGAAPLRGSGRMLDATSIPDLAYVDAVRAAPGVVLDLPLLCTHEVLHYQGRHRQPIMGGMADGDPFIRPAGLVERVREDEALAKLVDAAAGRGISQVSLTGEHSPRWVVVHMGLYHRGYATSCWVGSTGMDPARQAAAAKSAVERLLGPPDVEDQWAAAWDLTRRALP